MKYMITALLAPAAAFAGTAILEDRFEMSPMSTMSLSSGGCKNLDLIDNHILKASCTGWVTQGAPKDSNSPPEEAPKTYRDVQLDLDLCFANYAGTLNRAYNKGGFSHSCEACVLVEGGMKLRCACKTGLAKPKWKTTFAGLDDWKTIHVNYNGDLDCNNQDGTE